MHLKRLLTLGIVSASMIAMSACGSREVKKIEIPVPASNTQESLAEPTPIIVSIEPLMEAYEEPELLAEAIDYYAVEEVSRSASTVPATNTPSRFPEDRLTPEAEALFGPLIDWGEPYTGGTW
ncbi:MAG: hypothetical protein IKR39_08385 [Lachnospiraceae bacterium]|nr:hypothetical protein [Lachnospiraceae bacterium]